MSSSLPSASAAAPIALYDRVTLRPLNELQALHEPDFAVQIVPTHEADVSRGRISAEAPVGRAVLRRRLGETVTVEAQGRQLPMRILAIEKFEPDLG